MPDSIERHEIEYHAHDEELLSVVFGPQRSSAHGGGRDLARGLEYRMTALEAKTENQERAKLAISDKATIGVIVLAVEIVRLFL